MEGSPYWKSSISWKGGRSLGLVPGFLLAGTWSVPLSGTRGPGSCPEAGGNDTGLPFRQDSAPSVSLSWVPLKPELILNPERTEVFDMRWNPLGRRCNSGRVVLRVPLVPLVLETGPFLPTLSVSEMKAESGLSQDSSSIGSRVRSSKVKDAVAPLVSMDSSNSSLDLTAEVEDPKAIVARNVSPVAEGNWFPPIGPLSVIGVEEVADWRMKYNLPADVIIRVPGLEDRVLDFGVDEVPVYEGYFESGFRDRVPSLVAKISETLEISPGQLNPPAWRTLIALQNLGDLQGLIIGVAEVLCSYSVSPLSDAEWRYHLCPRGKEPPVREVPKRERKRLPGFSGIWTEKFPFMRLPGFLPIWQLEDLRRVDYFSGRETIERVLRLPIERRQIPFLVSKAALKRCSILGEMSGSKGDEALAEYKKALEVMSARKSAPKRAASVDDDEVQFLRSSKRLTVAATSPSSSKKKSKASGSSPSASYDWTTVFTNLNTKVFLSTPVLLASEEDSSVTIQSLQGDLLQAALKRCSIWGEMSGSKGDEALAEYKKALEVMSARKFAPKGAASVDDDEVQFLRSSKRLTVAATAPSSSKKKSKASGSSLSASYDWTTVLTNLNTKVFPSTPVLLATEKFSSVAIQSLQGDLVKVASQLFHLGERMVGAASTKDEMDALASQLREEKDFALAKDKEIKALRLKSRNQEEAGELAATGNVSLRGQLKNREDELNVLKDTTETFEAEKAMAVNGAKYKMVKITEAELLGLPTPSFEGEPQVPGDMEAEKMPEPAAEDPPAS
ncbi:hypothetical protein DY000_02008185 [Brassica cretica]|uniref:Uncharacterized protein n=1 Tax=Brassica cretica TaxID=69181 RepID=A0ABQ7C698_BRACR|nr:hypothetical protein DY000_02008185 [Brassica cretica]